MIATLTLLGAVSGAPVPVAAPPPGSAFVTFEVDEPEQSWSLRTKEGVTLCRLPCERWIPPKSGFTLDRDDQPPGKFRAYVPDTPAFGPNSRVRATVLPRRGSELGPALMLYCGGGLALAAIVGGAICLGLDCHMSKTASAAILLSGVAYGVASGWWYLWVRNSTSVDWTPEATAARFRPSLTASSGLLHARLGADGSGFVVGPGFLAGAF